jgi:fluoroquinolone transport system permease protein
MRAYSKRLFHTTLQDIRFQFRYGFYFLYAVLTVIYIAAISLLPAAWVQNAVAIVLFSDPAALGFFFMGGILLLEKGERLHDALFVSLDNIRVCFFQKRFHSDLFPCWQAC